MAKPKGKLFLSQWDREFATARAAGLSAAGWLVEMEFEEGSRGCRKPKAFCPDVVVMDVAQKFSHRREVGRALRQAKCFRETPFIFADGTDEEIPKVKRKVPGAIFSASGELARNLAKHAP